MNTRITQTRAQAVASAIGVVQNLAMLPEVATRILRVADDPDATVQDMADVMSHSPELSTRVLKVVNSAFYGHPGQVGSIHHAILLMGLGSVKNVAIAASLTRVFQGRPLSPRFSPKDLWRHSVAVAAATHMLATAMQTPLAEEALLAGLIHDVGILVEIQFDRTGMADVIAHLQSDESVSLVEAEERVFKANHQDFGAGLARHWHFPRAMQLVTGWHHHPLDLPRGEQILATMVHVADRLVASRQPAFMLEDRTGGPGDETLDVLRLTRGEIDAVEARLPAAIEETLAFLPA